MIKLYLDVGSASKFTADLHRRQRFTIAAGKEAVHEAANMIFDDSQTRVPFVTGALWASGRVVDDDSNNIGRSVIGYGDSSINPTSGKTTASYAEDIEAKHKFLENSLIDNAAATSEIFRKHIAEEFQK